MKRRQTNFERKVTLKNKKGITLIEVIIVIAIIGLLMMPMYDMMVTNNSIVRRTNEVILAKDTVLLVQQILLNQIQLATEMEIRGNEPTLTQAQQRSIYIDTNGDLILKSGPEPNIKRILCSKSLMGDYNVGITYSTSNGTILKVIIQAKKGSEVLYKNDFSTELMNLETDEHDSKITVTGSTRDYIKYTLPVTTPSP